ncbi:RING-H2 finger protein ATL78 [Sesamum angolense]|uniref:RING-type E3 ubiquitin transferase n=1 Tax=Sesamum angolense TaxID=2727404 RepID=A0AAE1XBG0_9LAMI|nr:RING-H2 finger protein ATL78 [Sesamum angolense]
MPTTYPNRLLLDSDIITVPPTNANKTNASYNETASFDSNMVIILAALLCALVCALGMNSIVRCALRCSGSRTFADDVAVRLASRSSSLKNEAALSQIPVVVYKPGLHIPATDCPICLGEFVEGEDVRILPRCNHVFHVKCIDRWLVLHSSCPTCRRPLVEDAASGNAENVRIQIS